MKTYDATTTESGYIGTLTQEQEDQLRKLWILVLDAFETESESDADTDARSEAANPQVPPGPREIAPMHRQADLDQRSIVNSPPVSGLRRTWLAMLKQENPDALLLRFLRARKWDTGAAFGILRAALAWRSEEMQVDEEVLPKGEPWCKRKEKNGTGKEQSDAREFLEQFRMGKVYLRGVDRHGRPVAYVHVALHNPAKQSQQTIEKLVVTFIETARTLFTPTKGTRSESFCIVFDLSGFSLSNMEWQAAKFVIKAFEANYPECLGTMLIHNAPWVFSGVWKIVRGLLDPVVAAKVDFTRSVQDLERYIARESIPIKFGGGDDWEYVYQEPDEDEDACIASIDEREKVVIERNAIVEKLLTATRTWMRHVDADEREGAIAQAQVRNDAIEALRVNYWALDPYVRSRTQLDRTGVIKSGGRIEVYPEKAIEGNISIQKGTDSRDAVTMAEEVELAA